MITTAQPLRGEYLFNRNAYIAGGEPCIFHCHHYNLFLQNTIKDPDYLEGIDDILRNAAQEIAFSQFNNYFKSGDFDTDSRKGIVEDYFRFAGFGSFSLENTNENGGSVSTSHEHYGIGWKSKYDFNSSEPIAFFATGFITGALEAAYGLSLGTLEGKQTTCISMGASESTFEISKSTSSRSFREPVMEGQFQEHELIQPEGTGVDYGAIRQALTNMPIEGGEPSGIIDAFGVLLTRHYANYYGTISYDFLNLFQKEMGDSGIPVAVNLLTEAGHVCAFNTFGGIMQSDEWNAMIKPMLNNKDEWIHGIVAVVNAFGWGYWEVDEFVPGERLRIKITSGYESNSYLKRYGSASIPVSFLATGGTAGLMNLIYVLNLPDKAPITLDDKVYEGIHHDPGMFTAKQLKCRAMGDDYDLFEATRK